ncbi:MAG: hypothetical protein LT080_10425 [Thiobacillus sp.]|nr:hypothetical protein [Thiobacillus sp.]
MAVIDGFLPELSIHGYDRLYITGDLDDYAATWINDIAYWAAPPSPGAGILTTHWPVSTTPLARSGHIAISYYDDFYNRIYVSPSSLWIGNLLTVQTRAVSIWNAWVTGQYLASIEETDTLGLTESGVVAPTTFAPLEEQAFYITADTQGPPIIDAAYIFHFPAESPQVSVVGRRVVVFVYPPNWAQPVVEKLNWLTDVMLSHGGIEQRVGLRDAPRRSLAYEVATLTQHQSNLLETMMFGGQGRLWAVPVWTDMQHLTVAATAGSTAFACVTADFEFTDGGLALFWNAYDQFEAVEIALVGDGVLLLTSELLATWPAGTRLYPVRLGQMPARQKFGRETGHHLAGTVEFAFDDNPAVAALDSGDVYDGYSVYAGRTNWADPTEVEFVRQLDTIDYETGQAWVDDLSGLATILKSWHWLFKSRSEIVAFRRWLAARAGRRVPFWSLSQGDDMEVIAPIGDSHTVIHIRDIGYQRFLDGRTDRRHICIRAHSGAMFYKRIVSASALVEGEEELTIDSPLGVGLQPNEIRSVHFMQLTRLETDAIEIEWHHLGVAEASTMMRSLPQ